MPPPPSSAPHPPAGSSRLLPADSNQARGLGEYCLEFLDGGGRPGAATLALLERFHLDSVGCGVSALAAGANATTVLRHEALATVPSRGSRGCVCFGAARPVAIEKGVAADVAAVREWDANGTNFGHDAARGRLAGEFGHNDFYPVALAVAREAGLDGDATLRVMLLVDEIRGRLAEVFPLRTFAIDHVHHGAVACAAAAAAVLGGDVDAIESAIGIVVAHYVPFRAIRAGHQLSDSKGASAALSAEVAVSAARRALAGFVGPRDVFRNPLAIYRRSIPCPDGRSPFDLELGLTGDAFAIHSMHFKLGLYEHQSAGALQALVDLFARVPGLADDPAGIRRIEVAIYEPAFSIIADPAKRSPTTRQSADHSLPYIVARTILKAREAVAAGTPPDWAGLMLLPGDYDDAAIADPAARALVERMAIIHGGPEYDAAYPDGIPTSLSIDHAVFGRLESGLVLYPMGHARSDAAATARLVDLKFRRLVAGAVDDADALRARVRLGGRSASDVAEAYGFPIHGCDPG